MKTQSGLKILRVRLDKGTEFAWNSLKSLSDEEGFTLGVSTPDTPAQNGKIERNGRIITTWARTTLITAKLPPFL